jgi:argininosuccinate lyase
VDPLDTTEFNFLELPDGFCTGSSIMPHKKNPDTLELTRGKSARVIGSLTQLLVLMKGLPMATTAICRKTRRAVFDAFGHRVDDPGSRRPGDRQSKFRRERIADRLEDGFLDATTLMEYFIAAGRADALGARGGRPTGAGVRGPPLPAGRAADREVRRGRPGKGRDVFQVLGVAKALGAFKITARPPPPRSIGSCSTGRAASAWRSPGMAHVEDAQRDEDEGTCPLRSRLSLRPLRLCVSVHPSHGPKIA